MACNQCSAGCAACSGCAGTLELTQWEIDFIKKLGQFSFLPVARKQDDMTPIFLEDENRTREECSLILQCLEKKGLIRLDYDKPLQGACMDAYSGYPVHGSMALTQRGYTVLDLLETQGIQSDEA